MFGPPPADVITDEDPRRREKGDVAVEEEEDCCCLEEAVGFEGERNGFLADPLERGVISPTGILGFPFGVPSSETPKFVVDFGLVGV